jgi:hypothetical protein
VARIALVLVTAALAVSTAGSAGARVGAVRSCPPQQVNAGYKAAVNAALAAKQDVWGNILMRSGGPSYDGVRRYLHPLMLVGPPQGLAPNRLTDSGVYYLALGQPSGSDGARSLDLHVADGSQIVSQFVRGPSLTVSVGTRRKERYGSCLGRLATPGLEGGYLPILETSYVGANGVRYSQESFATRIPQTRSLVSFVRLTVDPRGAGVKLARVHLRSSVPNLRRIRNQLRHGKRAFLVLSPGGRRHGGTFTFSTHGNRARTIYAAWLARPSPARFFRLGPRAYERAKQRVAAYWNRRLAAGAAFSVPDQHVMDAERNLLIQNLSHSWRYSLANPYARFSWELIDVGEVMGAYGFTGLERAIVLKSFHSRSVFPNRAAGERMVGAADYYNRTADVKFVRRVTPALRTALWNFQSELDASKTGLLDPERYGVDVSTPVYGVHDQAIALQGLRAMAAVWAVTRQRFLSSQATLVANRLEAGLRAAVRTSMIDLPDGSLFLPVALLDHTQRPYDTLTESQEGSYWNLVMPYALASGLFPPGSREAHGVLDYMFNHGSRLLGLVRFRAFTNSGKPGYRAPGSDDVYGTNVARFLADNHRADQLALSLYGKLGADMTPGTFVSGEGSTIGPVDGEYYRSMFRPPNSANNAFFLETLRLMLVHETAGADGTPEGLELAYSTPRRWLRAGRRIVVRRAQTSFGPLSYSLEARRGSVRVRVAPPSRAPRTLRLRLRLPAGERVAGVSVLGGRSFDRFDARSGTIDLSGLRGRVDLVVSYRHVPVSDTRARP